MIEVVDYDEAWPAQFEELAGRYRGAFDGVAVAVIEHVGSTSVPGLAAKPIIDVDIVVAEDDLEAASAALVAIGYEPLGDLGVPQRWAFRAPDGGVRTNTYVTVAGCLSLRNHLAVRDVLRADEGIRTEYGSLKRRLAAELDDIDLYVEAKSAMVQRILEQAGMSAADRAVIERQNRC
jgi:GrpB-like predicted nucleotidyltransferase (UPF0157 family)